MSISRPRSVRHVGFDLAALPGWVQNFDSAVRVSQDLLPGLGIDF
jgi:hypothetical protein